MIPLTIEESIRCLFFLVCYTAAPGFIITYFINSHREPRTFGSMDWWFGWSLVANTFIAYALSFLQGSLDVYAALVIGFNVIGTLWIVARALRHKLHLPRLRSRDLLYPCLILLLSLLWFGAMLRSGPRIDYKWDQWFHIAHIREAIESNRIVPNNPFWPDVPLSESYGLWHPLLAIVARSAGVSVPVVWRVGHAYIAALSLIVIYVVAGAFFHRRSLRLLAALVFLGSGFGGLEIMRTFIYPWGITNLLLWISLGIFFQYLLDGDWGKLLSATAIGLTPVLIHPQEYIFLCFAIFALGVSVILFKKVARPISVDLRRIWLVFALLVLLGIPVLLHQYPGILSDVADVQVVGSGASAELRLYEHPLAKLLAQAFPYFEKSGPLLLAFMPFNFISLLILFLLPGHLDKRVRWFFITLTWAPTLAAIFPGLSWVTGLVLKETYSWRLLNLIPTPFVWAAIIGEGISVKVLGKASKDGAATRFAGSLGWLYFALIVALIGSVILYASADIRRNEFDLVWASPLHAQTVFNFLDDLSPERATVLSDPETSYAIPGMTKHYVVLNEPMHGTRADIDLRFVETRELLSSPYQSSDAAIATLEKYAVDFILVNKLWLDRTFFLQTPFYSDYTLHFLSTNPLCFEPLYDDATFAAFRFLGCAPSEMVGKGLAKPSAVSISNVQYIVQKEFSSDLSLVGYSIPDDDGILPGDKLTVDLYWRVSDDIREPYATALVLLCDYPGRTLPYGKLWRIVSEAIMSRVFWVAADSWLFVPPEGFSAQRLNLQSFTLEIPETLAQSPCDLRVYVLERHQVSEQRILPFFLMEAEYTLPGIRLRSFD